MTPDNQNFEDQFQDQWQSDENDSHPSDVQDKPSRITALGEAFIEAMPYVAGGIILMVVCLAPLGLMAWMVDRDRLEDAKAWNVTRDAEHCNLQVLDETDSSALYLCDGGVIRVIRGSIHHEANKQARLGSDQ